MGVLPSPTRSGPKFGRRAGAKSPDDWSSEQVAAPPRPRRDPDRRRRRAVQRFGRRLIAFAALGAVAGVVLLWALQPVVHLHPLGAVQAAARSPQARAGSAGIDLDTPIIGGVEPGSARTAASTLASLPVAVVNASGRAGEARRAANDLHKLGFPRSVVGSMPARVAHSAVVYGPGWRDRALVLGRLLGVRVIPRGAWLPVLRSQSLVLLLGRDALSR